MNKLPDELLVRIFGELDLETRFLIELISKRWRDCVWDTFNSKEYLMILPSSPSDSADVREKETKFNKALIRYILHTDIGSLSGFGRGIVVVLARGKFFEIYPQAGGSPP